MAMKKKIKEILWLDDYRNPKNWIDYIKNVFPTIVKEKYEIVWVTSYDEFVKYINYYGLPDAIGFDHDLADEGPNEKTGYDAAKFLVDFINHNFKVKSLNFCSLLDKKVKREVEIDADYYCFEIDDKFLVGYGLDYDGYYRNLPYIGYV